jgi:ectoine hydroxylase-related dioxygenase (phytanoyl-CoA dioxygenase family)
MESKYKHNIEELEILGYTIIEDVLSKEELAIVTEKILAVNEMQKKETEPFFDITQTDENNIARAPFVYDDYFYNLLNHPKVMPFIKELLGNYFVLQAQNGVIVYPHLQHSMSRWHRDLSHQNFVAEPLIAVNAFFAITPFNSQTGATMLIPHSHRIGYPPSPEYREKYGISVDAPAGSVFFFNTMLFHQTGRNVSDGPRIGLSHMYTKYFIKQQMDVPALLKFKAPQDPFMNMLLGFDSWVPTDVLEFRKKRYQVGLDKAKAKEAQQQEVK